MDVSFVDSHAHFHSGFPWSQWLDAALENTARAMQPLRVDGAHCRDIILLLAQIATGDPLAAVRTAADRDTNIWDEVPTADPLALRLQRSEPCEHWGSRTPDVTLIAGRQLVTAERLEVLSLCCDADIGNGLDLSQTIAAVQAAGGVPVVPWGFGKWWAKRGRLLTEWIQQQREQLQQRRVFFADSGNRAWAQSSRDSTPREMGHPAILRRLHRWNVPVLAGSDPLPLPGHYRRLASCGNLVSHSLDAAAPSRWVTDRLKSESLPILGTGQTRAGFLADQIRLRWK